MNIIIPPYKGLDNTRQHSKNIKDKNDEESVVVKNLKKKTKFLFDISFSQLSFAIRRNLYSEAIPVRVVSMLMIKKFTVNGEEKFTVNVPRAVPVCTTVYLPSGPYSQRVSLSCFCPHRWRCTCERKYRD